MTAASSYPAALRPRFLPAAVSSFGLRRLVAGSGGEARLLAYSSGNFGKHLVFAGGDMTVLFLLTDLFGFSGGVAGALMLFVLAGDLVFDWLAAMLVIGLRKAGRDYRWLVTVSALPCGSAFALLYAMPAIGARAGWMLAGALLLFRGAYAVIDVPHNALMAHITSDGRARGRISGYRLLFSTAASLIVATFLAPTVQQAAHDRTFVTLAVTGGITGAAFVLTMVACSLTSGRTDRALSVARAATDSVFLPWRDPMVLAMGALAFLTGFAAPAFGRMLLYVVTYGLDRPAALQPLLVTITTGQFAGVLLWTSLTARYDKHRLLLAGHGVFAVALGLFGLCQLAGYGSLPALLVCAGLVGLGQASVFMLPWGVLADSVDFVAWRHGRRYEAGLFAFFLVVVKASGAIAIGATGGVLGWLGYVPGVAQPAAVQGAIWMLGLGVPMAGSLAAMLLLRRLDMGDDRHARLLAALEWRHSGRPSPAVSR